MFVIGLFHRCQNAINPIRGVDEPSALLYTGRKGVQCAPFLNVEWKKPSDRVSAGVTARKQTGDRKGDEIKEMQKLPRVLLRALRNSRCLSAITSPGHACSNTHFVFVFLNGMTQCENCPQPAWYQKAALLQQGGARQKRFHSVMIGWVILPSFSFFLCIWCQSLFVWRVLFILFPKDSTLRRGKLLENMCNRYNK